jgi:hypothetical protein
MLSSSKLKEVCSKSQISIEQVASQIERGGLNKKEAVSAVKNWQRGRCTPAGDGVRC